MFVAVSYITYMTELVKQPTKLKKKALSPKQRQANNFQAGALAENLATEFLKKKNYVILERNLQFKNWEVDLIALDQEQNEIVFVEVKHRANRDFGGGEIAVDYRKVKKMQQVAMAYLREHQFKKAYRFDIITSVGNYQQPKQIKIEHFENITWLA